MFTFSDQAADCDRKNFERQLMRRREYRLKPPNPERQKAFLEELSKERERSRVLRNEYVELMLKSALRACERETPYKDERWKDALVVFGLYFFFVWLCY